MKKTDTRTAFFIEQFLTATRARKASPRYIEKLQHTLGFLARYAETLPTTTDQLDRFFDSLNDYRKANGQPMSDETHVEIWASTKRLYRWISRRTGWTKNPMLPIDKPIRRNKEPRVLSEHDVLTILDANRTHPRDYAMLCVMLDTMARLGEIAALTWEHIEPAGPDAHFPRTGKRGARTAPLNPDTLAALRTAAPPSRTPYLWTDIDGNPITQNGLKMAFRRALKRAGFTGNPHLMRHTAATIYVRNGGDLFSLMRIGGWTSLKAVQIYVHLANSDIRDQHAKYSTIARHAHRGTQLRLIQEA